ncbi:AEC family transporter [Leucothrix sargassi]|nr:AEC family transporter [Leucothrix sargassi]
MLSSTLIPIILMILLGYTLKHKQFVSDSFWRESDRAVYYIFLPALLFSKIATMSLQEIALGQLLLIILILLITTSAVLLLIQRLHTVHPPTFTSVFQGATRFNSFIALSMATTAWASPVALQVAALILSIKVILVNVLCVSVFSHYTAPPQSLSKKLGLIFKNPLIAACALGLLVNTLSLPLPVWVLSSLDLLGKAALTLGVLSVGAGLIINFSGWLSFPTLLATCIKLLILPIAAYYLGSWFVLDLINHQVLVLIFAMPTAVSSYILAGQLGGDQPVMAKIITIETILAGVTMLPILAWIGST